jgi:hypothetical protein
LCSRVYSVCVRAMLGLVMRTVLLVSSISLNVRMCPVETMTEVHVFVSSVIILVCCAQGLVIYIVCLLLQYCFAIKLNLHGDFLFTPLTVALATTKELRRGDFDTHGHTGQALFVLTDAKLLHGEESGSETGSDAGTPRVPRATAATAPQPACELGAGTGLNVVSSVDDHMDDHMGRRARTRHKQGPQQRQTRSRTAMTLAASLTRTFFSMTLVLYHTRSTTHTRTSTCSVLQRSASSTLSIRCRRCRAIHSYWA